MKNSKILFYGLINSFGVLIYVSLVVTIMQNGQRLFGPTPGILGAMAILLLFVVSAAITGLLVFGRPIYFYLNGLKSESIKLLFYTLGWLILETLIIFIALFLMK